MSHATRSTLEAGVEFTSSEQFNARAKKPSGVDRFHVHQLRHTFACEWVDRGGNLAALQTLLGQSSVTVTQRYGRISDTMVRAEVMRLTSVASAVASNESAADESVG